MNKYNDQELLYLLYEGEEIAQTILLLKYRNLIYKRLKAFRIKKRSLDDYFQEGLMALNDAINSYNPLYRKTFTKYFDLILQRRIINLLRKEYNYFYKVMFRDLKDYYLCEEPKIFTLNSLSSFEYDVYVLRFLQNYRPEEIAKLLHCQAKKVYNTIYIVKQKLYQINWK